MTTFETVIGLEVHVQLGTQTKLFCSCPTTFGAKPNTQACPVCLGFPGVLPVLNRKAFELAIRAACAVSSAPQAVLKFDRKNYFYPDLPKAFQISQYDQPLALGGYVEIETASGTRRIRLRRVHLEEDAGKLIHEANASLVDFNRCGMPLVEIVSEPDLRSPDEAYQYLTTLKTILQYAGVSECDMEQGSLRCDANISVRPAGSTELGVKTEIKNLNSFRAVRLALEHEAERQVERLQRGQRLVQETRLWREEEGRTYSMRSKEEAHDYRYFPEPDLMPFTIAASAVDAARRALPELPQARQRRYHDSLGLSEYDAKTLTASKALSDYFEACLQHYDQPKPLANWITSELVGRLNALNIDTGDTDRWQVKLPSAHLASMVRLIDQGTISGKIAKELLDLMLQTGQPPEALVQERNLVPVRDEGELARLVDEALKAHPQAVEDYFKGKGNALQFLVGQVMRQSQGKAHPGRVNELVKGQLEARRAS